MGLESIISKSLLAAAALAAPLIGLTVVDDALVGDRYEKRCALLQDEFNKKVELRVDAEFLKIYPNLYPKAIVPIPSKEVGGIIPFQNYPCTLDLTPKTP